MAEHELTVTVERGGIVSTQAHCNAADDAACRNMPECICEGWDLERDEKGWYHTVDGGFAVGQDMVNLIHRHTQLVDCNVCEWINADDAIECLDPSVKSFQVASVPIRAEWDGAYYLWKPVG
jgi:hypothetical protein